MPPWSVNPPADEDEGKVNAWAVASKALRYLSATVTTAVLFYVLFALLFSTERRRRLQLENDLYATYYPELREKERLTDVVEGLEVQDDALYRRIFETEAPSVDALTAADLISVIPTPCPRISSCPIPLPRAKAS